MATILFADVQGFTSLAEQQDFETVSDLIASVVGRVFWVGALVAIAGVNPGTGTLALMRENVRSP